jgi:two-component system, NarL family, sensor histidine kinase DegS
MPLPPPQTKEFHDRIVALEDEARHELELSVQSLNEIALLLNKTNSEVEKLAARELQMSNRVRDMEMHLDNYSREDIRDLYNTSHEIQLRLFMMRSQAEQLQNRQQHIKEYQEKLRLLIDLLSIQAMASAEEHAVAAAPRGHTATLTAGLPANGGPSILSIIEAQEDERLRISRQIHDGPTQALTNLILRAEICERLIDRDVNEARSELSSLKAMIGSSLQETRRMIFDLRPMILDDLGLVPTLRRYVNELARMKQMQGSVSGPEHDIRLNTTMQVALFRMTQTMISAVLAEGPADHIDIHIEREATVVRVHIDASSLDTDRDVVEERLADPHFKQRLDLLGAMMTVEPRSNRGIAIEVMVPAPEEATL